MIPSPSICEVNRPLWWNGFLMDCEFPGKPAREKYSIIKILFHYYGFSTKDKKGITIKRQFFLCRVFVIKSVQTQIFLAFLSKLLCFSFIL